VFEVCAPLNLKHTPLKLLRPCDFKSRNLREGIIHGECVIPMLSIFPNSISPHSIVSKQNKTKTQREVAKARISPMSHLACLMVQLTGVLLELSNLCLLALQVTV
jgi:hypothetical protein